MDQQPTIENPAPADTMTTAAAPAPPTPAPRGTRSAGSLVPAILGLLTIDVAVETIVAGSPILWAVVGVEMLALVVLTLLWSRVGSTTRVAIPLLALLGVIAWAGIRLGSGADPALRLATFGLPRIVLGLAIAATLTAGLAPFGLRICRRAWYLGLVLVVAAACAVVPMVRGLLAGAGFSQVAAGTFDWAFLPAWLHGAVVATQVILPIGLLAAVLLAARALVKHLPATWAVAATSMLACALLVQSSEMLRAGRASLLAPIARPLVAALSSGPIGQGAALASVAASAPGVSRPGGVAAQAGGAASFTSGPITPAPAGAVLVAPAGRPIANRAIELSVTGYRSAPSVGSETARPGREFVIVETAWKNILPQQKVNRKKTADRTAGAGSLGFGGGRTAQDQADDDANTTIESVKFEVSPLAKHVWLVADGRFAEGIAVGATRGLPGHLGPEGISIATFQQTVAGGIVFEAPAGSTALSLLLLDSSHGHILVPIKGAPPVLASSLGSGSRANAFVDIAATSTSWASAPVTTNKARTFVVGLRGISRQNAIVDVPFGDYAFLQTDQGCLVEPDQKAEGLARSLAPIGRFLPFVPSEGQLAFQVPPDAHPIALLVRLQQGGPIDLPLGPGAAPRWPQPAATVTDGDVLRTHRLPGLVVPAGMPQAPSGKERVALDLVVENQRTGSGIELQQNEQFRLVGPDGTRYPPAADSALAPCRLTGGAVVPAGGSRRFTLVYDVPPGQPLQFEYRGFKVKSELIKVR